MLNLETIINNIKSHPEQIFIGVILLIIGFLGRKIYGLFKLIWKNYIQKQPFKISFPEIRYNYDKNNKICAWEIKMHIINNTNRDIILTPAWDKQNDNIRFAHGGSIRADENEYDKFYIYNLGQFRIPAKEKLSSQFHIKYKINCKAKRQCFKQPTLVFWKEHFESLKEIKLPLELR